MQCDLHNAKSLLGLTDTHTHTYEKRTASMNNDKQTTTATTSTTTAAAAISVPRLQTQFNKLLRREHKQSISQCVHIHYANKLEKQLTMCMKWDSAGGGEKKVLYLFEMAIQIKRT